MFNRLANLASNRARLVTVVAVMGFFVAAGFGSSVADHLAPYGADDNSTESVQADQALHSAGYRDADTIVLIKGVDVRRSAEDRRKVKIITRQVLDSPGVASATGFLDTRDPRFVSIAGDQTFLAVSLDSTDDDQLQSDAAALAKKFEVSANVSVGGISLASEQVNKQIEKDLQRSEIIAFPILLLLSLIFFRSLVAALLPLMVGALAIVGTFFCLRLASEFGSISYFALNLTTGLGLGLAIDYSLFIVSRYREEIAVSGPGPEAMKRTMNTAGRTVLFSSLTVTASMAALLIFPQRFLYSMGLGGALVAVLASLISLTILPAVLTLLGDRVNSLAPKFLQRREGRESNGDKSGFWYRLSRFVMRRPVPVATLATLLLVFFSLPALGMVFKSVDAYILPPDASARQVQTEIDQGFDNGESETVRIVVKGNSSEANEAFGEIVDSGVMAAVRPPRELKDGIWLIDAQSTDGYMKPGTIDAVADLRALPSPAGTDMKVSGNTAHFRDFQSSLLRHLPIAISIVVGATLLVLFMMTGSVVLPVKSLIMNLLNLGAVFGILVFVFQDGHFSGLLSFETPGGLDQSTPILIFALAFGLSTDYAVFLLSRIKEARDGGLENDEAVAVGLERTGRIVTAAALLFAIAVGAFATSEIVFIKELGVGTALAVLIDATIIRALLVPALMKLLGRRNWWAPAPLRRIHDRWGITESGPSQTETRKR